MGELKQFYTNLDFDFDELMKSLYLAQKSKKGSMDELFKVDDFVNMCRWFLGDALRALDKIPPESFEDLEVVSLFHEKLTKIVEEINVPFSVLQRKRWEVWKTLPDQIIELSELL